MTENRFHEATADLRLVTAPTRATRPLIVRLRNWIGDVVLGVPALRLLSANGYRLHLVGKRWAQSLLEGEGWSVSTLPGAHIDRVRLLRQLCHAARAEDAGFDSRTNAIAFPYSFSSAVELRLAGLRAIGYAGEGRRLLLHRSLPRLQQGRHELETYWQVACSLLDVHRDPPASIDLKVSAAAHDRAETRLAESGIAPGFVMLCPFAGGTFEGHDKQWPQFEALAVAAAKAWKRPLVLCPGPNEATTARERFASALTLEEVSLGEYAALLQRSGLMVSNDTGPGHLAAAVGAPLLSVLGPTNPAQWRAWGPSAHIVQRPSGWPTVDDVLEAGTALLQPDRQHVV
jgi:heptosyltransferase II